MKEYEVSLTIQPQTGYAGHGGNSMVETTATQERPQPAGRGTKENLEGTAVKKSQSSGKPTGTGDATTQEKQTKEGTLSEEQLKALKKEKALFDLFEAKQDMATVDAQMQQTHLGRMELGQLEKCIKIVSRVKRKASKQNMAIVGVETASGFMNLYLRATQSERILKNEFRKKGGNLGGLEQKIFNFVLGTDDVVKKKTEEEAVQVDARRRHPEKPPVEEVFANAEITDDTERIAKAEVLLKRKETLTDIEQQAIIDAHKVGADDENAGVYNYTQEQIAQKARILHKAGFSPAETRLLMEAGIAGVAVPPAEFATFDAARFAGTPLAPLAEELKNLGEGNFADQEGIEDIARRAAGVGAAPAERAAFVAELNRFKGRAVVAEAAEEARRSAARGGGRRGRDDFPIDSVRLKIVDLDIPEIGPIKVVVEAGYDAAWTVTPYVQELLNALRDPDGIPKSKITEILRHVAMVLPATPEGSREQADTQKFLSAVRELERFIDAKVNTAIVDQGQRGLYRDIALQRDQKITIIKQALADEESVDRQELEHRFNQYFSQADIDTNNDWREALGQRMDFELRDFLDTLDDASLNKVLFLTDEITGRERPLIKEERDKIDVVKRRFVLERETRQYLHEIVRLVNTNASTQDMEKMSARFTSDMSDTAYRMKGVTSASHFFENAMYRVMVKYGGYLPYESMINKVGGGLGEVESIVQEQMKKEFPTMDEWERNRAIAVARGMGMVSVRFFEIASQGQSADVPLVGWWANQIIKKFAYFRHVHRFNIGQERNTFMYYRIDGKDKRSWWKRTFFASTDFQDGIDEGTAGRTKFFNGQDDDAVYRWFDNLNIFNCGSLWTQTGWRWRDSFINQAGFLAKLLKHDKYNPLAGLGLWIERTKGDLSGHDSHKEVDPAEMQRLRDKFKDPHDVAEIAKITNRHKRAHFLIEKYLYLAVKVSPLKLLNNLPGFRNKVIEVMRQEESQAERIRLGEHYDEKQFEKQFQERLGKTLDSLSTFQEALQRKRVQGWDEHVAKLERGEESNYDLFRNDADLIVYINGEVAAHRIPHEEGELVIALIKKTQHEFSEEGGPKRINDLMKDLQEHPEKVPFVLGTDDIALDKLSVVGGGPDAIKRRWEDMLSSAGAAEQFGKLIMGMSHYHNQEDILKNLNEIYSVLQGHDEGVARVFMKQAMEGIIKFYKKDLMARMPFGIGSLYGLVKGRSSMAQKVYHDRGQMAWDELDIDAFIKKGHGLINEEQQEDLRKKVGATNWNKFEAYARTLFMFALAGYIFYQMKKQTDEK